MATEIRLRRGVVASLPTTEADGVPLWTTDTETLYISDGDGGAPPRVLMAGTGIVVNADINAAAAIARSKIAAGTASHVVTNDGSGNLTSVAALTVANGGTGLATLTANNVILGNGTSNVAFVAPSTSGNVLTSNGTTWTSAAASGSGTIYRKTADETRNSNTFSDDVHIINISLAATKNYTFMGALIVHAGSANPDIKIQLVDTGGATFDHFWVGVTCNSGTSLTYGGALTGSSVSSGMIALATTTNSAIIISGCVGVTSGTATLKLQWAQNTTDAGNLVTLREGSFIRVQEAI